MTRILVTNDDGVQAPGILALTQAMQTLGEVIVVAPAINQSAIGHKKTLFQDIRVDEVTLADGTSALAVHNSPADCIALSALGLVAWPPDIVVSGVNNGANMGQDITYSGTVTAALEATINGVPALAVSLDRRDAQDLQDFVGAAQIAARVAARVLEQGLPALTILNLNVPGRQAVKGLRLTRQGIRIYRDELEHHENFYSIVGPEPSGYTDEQGTDLWAVHHGYASLTPLQLDLTAHHFMAELAAWDITE